MPKEKSSFEALRAFLPEGSFDHVMEHILLHKVHLTISRERQTKLGDYRHAYHHQNHRISVNGNLHPYAFLITLLHELAHLLAFEKYGVRIQPHGIEWKTTYSQLIAEYLQRNVFPADVAHELKRMLRNPAASSGAEDDLQRVLRKYEQKVPGVFTVEELKEGEKFLLGDGRTFIRGEKIRKRIKCIEMPGNKIYLFQPLCEVKIA